MMKSRFVKLALFLFALMIGTSSVSNARFQDHGNNNPDPTSDLNKPSVHSILCRMSRATIVAGVAGEELGPEEIAALCFDVATFIAAGCERYAPLPGFVMDIVEAECL